MPACSTCHGELYADRKSVADAAAVGCHGGRIFCVLGCTDIWLMERRVDLTVAPTVISSDPPNRAGYHLKPRKKRLFECQRCHEQTETTCSAAKWCAPCRRIVNNEREVIRQRMRRQRIHELLK